MRFGFEFVNHRFISLIRRIISKKTINQNVNTELHLVCISVEIRKSNRESTFRRLQAKIVYKIVSLDKPFQ